MSKISMIGCQELFDRFKEYAFKVGRVAVRLVFLLYYLLRSEDIPRKNKITIFGAFAYLVFLVDLLDAKRLPIIGWLDEIASMAVAFQRMSKQISPEMKIRVDEILER